MEFGYIAFLLMGIVLGMIGGGGSILTVPILVYLFKMNGLVAATFSLFIVGSTASVGAFLNWKKNCVDFSIAVRFAIPSFLGVLVARRLVLPNLPPQINVFGLGTISLSSLTLIFFALIMLAASRAMISGMTGQPSLGGSIFAKAFAVGVVTGIVGAGGGFLIVPALVFMLGLSMHRAVGTSLAIIATNSLLGFFASSNMNSIDWIQLISMAAVGIVGLLLGAGWGHRIPDVTLKKYFGYFVLILGIILLGDQLLAL